MLAAVLCSENRREHPRLISHQGKGNRNTRRLPWTGISHASRRVFSCEKRLENLANRIDALSFYACPNTMERMEKAEDKRPEIDAQAILVPAGLPEVIELQRIGWSNVKL